MTINSMGDLAHHLMLRTRSTTLSNQVATLTQELSSGQVSNTTKHLNGDISELLSIERDIDRASAFQSASREAAVLASAQQASLTQMQDTAQGLSASLLQIGDGLDAVSTAVLAHQSEQALGTIIGALNTEVADQALFSGTATDRTAMQPVETLMEALTNHVSGAQSAAEVRLAVETWFEDPAGFDQVMYGGASNPRDPISVGPNDQVRLTAKADDPLFRDLMETVAIGALAGRSELSLSDTERRNLLTTSGQKLPTATDDLTILKAQIGRTEARIEEATTRHAATISGLEMARTTLLRADPYETAVELEQVQFQLQSLYTLTARNARFSLLSYLE